MEGDENKAEVMRAVVANLDIAGHNLGCPVVLIHHTRKMDKLAVHRQRTTSDVRGSNVLTSGSSVIILVEKQKSRVSWEAHFTVRCEDSWYQKFDTMCCVVDWREQTPPGEAMQLVDPDELSQDKGGRKPVKSDPEIDADVLSKVRESVVPISQNKLRKLVGGRKERVDAAIRRLLDAGSIHVPRNGKGFLAGPDPDRKPG